ncbi:diaminopimelate decarboxylase [Proteinivorax hydrogeniformans]|uniref:Diaminopimelate decarboxylase n=1 Tax=Proteinivorax hydrogeniformans TaxID=1826727 RepID=A0AAU8HRH3_9FIRM
MKLFGTMEINSEGHLEIGGCDSVSLASEYGTPLYIVDEKNIRNRCRIYKESFTSESLQTEVIYASKAFLNIAMCKLIANEGLSLDVVSGGELYTAIKADFPRQKIYFHGNNKLESELYMAVENNVGRIIIDNVNEFKVLSTITKNIGAKVEVLLRVNPGIEAYTHEYISTTKSDSKFGESIFADGIYDFIKEINDDPNISFKGLHSHIGSQIFEEGSFLEQATVMLKFIKSLNNKIGVQVNELNLGGGFGIYYTESDDPIDLPSFFERLLSEIDEQSNLLGIIPPKVLIEPGRSIVANAGTTLYKVGSTKTTYSGKNYVFVDGSMADNIRPALYGAKHEFCLANRMNDKAEKDFAITGKCCESGDILGKSFKLAKPNRGDLVAVSSTGAYNYSMASNYNRLTKPAVVFVKDGKAKIVVRRETYEDIIKNDVDIEG